MLLSLFLIHLFIQIEKAILEVKAIHDYIQQMVEIELIYYILKRSLGFLLCTKKETNCVLVCVNTWVRALGPCLLLLQSA